MNSLDLIFSLHQEYPCDIDLTKLECLVYNNRYEDALDIVQERTERYYIPLFNQLTEEYLNYL